MQLLKWAKCCLVSSSQCNYSSFVIKFFHILFLRNSVRSFRKSQTDKRAQLEELANFFDFASSALPGAHEVLKITKTRAIALLLKENIRVIEFKRVGSVAAFEVINSSNMDPFECSFRNVGYFEGTFWALDVNRPIAPIKSEFLGKESLDMVVRYFAYFLRF